MGEPWGEDVPPLDFSSLNATPSDPPYVTPNHRAGDDYESPVDSPKQTVRQRLMDATKAKPRARNVKSPRPRKVVPNVPGQFVGPLTELYTGAALLLMPFEPELSITLVSPHRGPTEEDPKPVTTAERCAVAWDEAAQRNESVRRMLDGFLTVSVWGALIAAHAPLLMILAKNHTKFGAKFDPAAAMEEMLRRQAEGEESNASE